ncbi:MAG: bifunctional DNA-formamidopyrimidine glycosylase/DNA-(apurinic or apyrimidinic site) lyase [Candidatus Cloacimonetes bacterium]|nr:bifunctional DNA-formamidopyrimidine glycosylase/DNA-(apurinic or apyrimidinic site) lyase [Candidatus Cloacimonadota bacterium]
MPELPEVETVVRQLRPMLVGQRIQGVRILDAKLSGDYRPITGALIEDVQREGKQILLCLKGRKGPHWLAVHLRMTGRLQLASFASENSQRFLRAEFSLGSDRLQFSDTRRFGTLILAGSRDDLAAPGVDPTGPAFTTTRLAALLNGSRSPLKTWLLRQDRITGIGNIYACEILFESGLHPFRAAGSLEPDEIKRLHTSTRRVLRRAIKACGTTFDSFQDARGVEGSYQRYLKVYGRTGEYCGVCATPIERIIMQQRGTWWCPRCQPVR